jgi:threonylcarbamoyladenosine tRNA methylthiotransferase MtaB
MVLPSSTVAFHTLGCKLNFSETSTLARKMQEKGFAVVEESENSDVYVINTCSVTDNADKKCRHFVRKALRKNPEAKIVVVGCYAQLKPHEIASIKGVDMVLGAKEKFMLPEILSALTKNPCGQVFASPIEDTNFFVDAYSVDDRTRSFLKIQDGCDYKCSFCTIPLARGKSRSDTPENILKNISLLAQKNIKEIVLTGVNTGDYGANMSFESNFLQLIKLLDEVEGIERFRISSIEPNLLTDEIIQFVATSKKFVPHFHIPLQSGSDRLLSLMRRRYKKDLYQSRIELIKSLMPHACIGVDVISGFPSESESDFVETYNFIEHLDISYIHAFTYSERNNTLAADMQNAIPVNIREARTNRLRTLSNSKRESFYKKHINTTKNVLWESENKNNLLFGFTENYIKVCTAYDEKLINTITKTHLEDFADLGIVQGKIINI